VCRVSDDYFDDAMVNRQRLLWAVATRRQLERWEPLVARHVRLLHAGRQLDGEEIWAAAIEHHFALIAARHLLEALDLPPPASGLIEATVRAELIEGRHLHEHWRENMPVFMTSPRPQPPHPSGQRFADRNPDRGPYWWLDFSPQAGAQLLPNVSAPALHELLDGVEAEVLAEDAGLSDYVPPRAPSPWIREKGEWSPKADV
jgi:hypothetical protein